MFSVGMITVFPTPHMPYFSWRCSFDSNWSMPFYRSYRGAMHFKGVQHAKVFTHFSLFRGLILLTISGFVLSRHFISPLDFPILYVRSNNFIVIFYGQFNIWGFYRKLLLRRQLSARRNFTLRLCSSFFNATLFLLLCWWYSFGSRFSSFMREVHEWAKKAARMREAQWMRYREGKDADGSLLTSDAL